MNSKSISSFVNGLITGAAAMLAIIFTVFLLRTAPLEGKLGFATTEIRVAIFLGTVVCVATIIYEAYNKKESKKTKHSDDPEQGKKESN